MHQSKLQELQDKYDIELRSITSALKEERRKNSALDSKNSATLPTTTPYIKRGDELVDIEKDMNALRKTIQEYKADKDKLEEDLESTCQALHNARNERKEWLKEKLSGGQSEIQHLTSKLEVVTRREEGTKMRCCDLEDQLDTLRSKCNQSEERNSWYEEGHDLSDAVKYQKKLEADIRRRDYDLKEIRSEANLREDQIKYYSTLCDLLKDKVAVPADIEFIEEQVKEKVQNYDNRLKSQNNELWRQVEVLERERNDLMKRLRENAAQIGQKGSNFFGLSGDQLVQVMEFATNVRNGNVCLPLNDKSLELTAQLASINIKRTHDRVTIERLEREIQEFKEENGLHEHGVTMELNVMRRVLEGIQKQNNKLRNQVDTLTKSDKVIPQYDKVIPPQTAKQEDLLSPLNQKRIEEIIGERLVDIPFKGQMQVLCLTKEYDKVDQELSILKTSMQRWYQNGHNYKQREKEDNQSSKVGTDKNNSNNDPLRKDKAHMVSPLGSICQKPQQFSEGFTKCEHQPKESQINLEKPIQHQQKGQSSCRAKANLSTSSQPPPSSQDAQVQVDGDITQIEMMERELIQTKESVQRSEHKIILLEKKINRLQCALQESSLSNGGDRTIMAQATIKQLTQLLDEKNRVIRKYRKQNSVPFSVTSEILKRLRRDQDFVVGGRQEMFVEEAKTEDHTSRLAPETNVTKLSSHDHKMNLILREKEITIETMEIRFRNIEASRKEAIDEVKRLEKKLTSLASGHDTKEANTSTSTDNDDMAKRIEEMQNELKNKDAKMKRLASTIKQVKASQKQPEESINQIESLKKEVERVRMVVSVTRRAKEKCERDLILAERAKTDMSNGMDRLQKENSNIMRAQKDKRIAETKAKNITVKFTQLQELMQVSDTSKTEQTNLTSKLNDKVITLQKENAKLRGNLASHKLEVRSEDKGHVQSSRPKVSLSTRGKKEVLVKGPQKDTLNDSRCSEDTKKIGVPSDETTRKSVTMFDLAALEEVRDALFSSKEENMRLTRLHKFEIPFQLDQLKLELKEVSIKAEFCWKTSTYYM